MTEKLTVPILYLLVADPLRFKSEYQESYESNFEEEDEDEYLETRNPLDDKYKCINSSKDLPYGLTQVKGDQVTVREIGGGITFTDSFYWFYASLFQKGVEYGYEDLISIGKEAEKYMEMKSAYDSSHDLFFENDKFIVRPKISNQSDSVHRF
jgi:hypothetical protein